MSSSVTISQPSSLSRSTPSSLRMLLNYNNQQSFSSFFKTRQSEDNVDGFKKNNSSNDFSKLRKQDFSKLKKDDILSLEINTRKQQEAIRWPSWMIRRIDVKSYFKDTKFDFLGYKIHAPSPSFIDHSNNRRVASTSCFRASNYYNTPPLYLFVDFTSILYIPNAKPNAMFPDYAKVRLYASPDSTVSQLDELHDFMRLCLEKRHLSLDDFLTEENNEVFLSDNYNEDFQTEENNEDFLTAKDELPTLTYFSQNSEDKKYYITIGCKTKEMFDIVAKKLHEKIGLPEEIMNTKSYESL